MPRRFNGGSDCIIFSTTADLAGFNLLFGTVACELNVSAVDPDNSIIFVTNQGTNPCCDFYISGVGSFLGWFDGVNFRESTIAVPLNENIFVAATKATGTVAARLHMYRYSNGTWAHQAAPGTSVNGGAVTHLMIGEGIAAGVPLSADMAQIGAWSAFAMTDSEVERLLQIPKHDWGRVNAEMWLRFDAGHDFGSPVYGIGRRKMRSTSATGAVRSTLRHPAGFGTLPSSRRR